MLRLAFIPLLFLYGCCQQASIGSAKNTKTCYALAGIEMCEPLGYLNVTLPNPRGHKNGSEANAELNDFKDLVESGCSLYLRHFLCAYYAPLCKSYLPFHLEVLPCRELCVHVKGRCEALLIKHGLYWPQHLQCGLFPNKTEAPWCFGPEESNQLKEDDAIIINTSTTIAPSLSTIAAINNKTISTTSASITISPSIVQSNSPPPKQCESIPISSICSLFDYKASYPNVLGHSTMMEAENSLKSTIDNFVLYNCSPNAFHLYCYHYHPPCISTDDAMLNQPCKELCEQVKDDCRSSLREWPSDLDCDKLPSKNTSGVMCEIGSINPSIVGIGGGGAGMSNNVVGLAMIIGIIIVVLMI